MTHYQQKLVKQSWKLLREINPALLGDVFYGRLFLHYPHLRAMFTGPMDRQYQKFVDMLSFIVARLDRPDTMADEIRELTRSHAGYGVKLQHYAPVKESLLWTLERGLGHDWNEQTRQAWETCYDLLTQAMTETTD
jgi:hemoglobin-like flavoprotein